MKTSENNRTNTNINIENIRTLFVKGGTEDWELLMFAHTLRKSWETKTIVIIKKVCNNKIHHIVVLPFPIYFLLQGTTP